MRGPAYLFKCLCKVPIVNDFLLFKVKLSVQLSSSRTVRLEIMANYLTYCVFVFAIFIMSICVWLNVANTSGSSGTLAKRFSNSEADGELIFVHVVCDFS